MRGSTGMMRALEPFEVTVTFCFTPEHRGLAPHHTSPPLVDEEFAEFCARMLRRYWRAGGRLRADAARLTLPGMNAGEGNPATLWPRAAPWRSAS